MRLDDPRHLLDAADDAYRRQPFVARCSAVLDAQRRQEESAVIGLVGAWGSGKSTTLGWVLSRLDRQQWRVVEMGAWAVAGPDGVTLELLRTLKVAFGARWWTPAASAIRRIARVAVPVGAPVSSLLSSVAGLGWVGDVLAKLRLDGFVPAPASSPVPDQITALGRLIEKREGATLVVIDDVDRLQPDELLALFKAVRVLGRLPRVHYLLAYDEETLLQLMGETPVGRGASERSLAYLEKVVTLRLDQPPPTRDDAESLLRQELDEAFAEAAATPSDEQRGRLDTEVTDLLSEVLTTARRVHRFTAQLRTYLPLLTVEAVDVVDFSVLALVRIRYPQLYNAIARDRRVLTTADVTGDEGRLRRWRDRTIVDESGVPPDERAAVQAALTRMFSHSLLVTGDPSVKMLIGMTHRAPRRASDADYIDRYLALAPPAEDSDEPLITRALQEWMAGEPGPAAQHLAAVIADASSSTAAARRAARVLRLAETTSVSAPAAAARAALALFPVPRGRDFGADPYVEAQSWLATALRSSTPGVNGLLHLAQAGTDAQTVARLTALCEVVSRWELPRSWAAELRDGVVHAAWDLCEEVARRGGEDGVSTASLLRALDEASPASLDALVPEAVGRGVDVVDLASVWVDDASVRRGPPDAEVALSVIRMLGAERVRKALTASTERSPDRDQTVRGRGARRELAQTTLARVLTAEPERSLLPRGVELVPGQPLGTPPDLLRQRNWDAPDIEIMVSGLVPSDDYEISTSVPSAIWDAVVEEVVSGDPMSLWLEAAAPAWNALSTASGWRAAEDLPQRPKLLIAGLTSQEGGSGWRQRTPVQAAAQLSRVPVGTLAGAAGLRLTVAVGVWVRELDEHRMPGDRVASETPLPAALVPEELGCLVDAATRWVLCAVRSARPLLASTEAARDVRLESRIRGGMTLRQVLKVPAADITWRAGSTGATASTVLDVQQVRLEASTAGSAGLSALLLDRWLSYSGGVPHPDYRWLPVM